MKNYRERVEITGKSEGSHWQFTKIRMMLRLLDMVTQWLGMFEEFEDAPESRAKEKGGRLGFDGHAIPLSENSACPSVQVHRTIEMICCTFGVKKMGIAADVLGLRTGHFSSVSELLAALDQVSGAPVDKIPARVFLAHAAADLVLTNVAAHAAEALNEESTPRKTRRRAPASGRKNRRAMQAPSPRQRILFA